MNRLGYLILLVLYKSEAFDDVNAMTVKEMIEKEDLGYKENTIFKRITEFVSFGYVGNGFKDGNAKTFYITSVGRELLINIRNLGGIW